MSHLGGVGSKLEQIERITKGALGEIRPREQSPLPLANFCDFFPKTCRYTAIWIAFCTLLETFERTEFMKFKSHLKENNCPATPLLTYRSSPNMFKRMYFGVKYYT